MPFSCFLKLNGIDGESTIKGYENWIELDSVSFGATLPMSHSVSTSGPQSAGKVDLNPIGCNKKVDKATNKLFLHCWTGEHVTKGEIHICSEIKGKLEKVYTLKLEDIVVISISGQASKSGPEIDENFSLSYGKVTVEYFQFDSKGTAKGTVPQFYDARTNVHG